MESSREGGPIALRAYEKLAERYAALVDTKAENAYCERPGTLSLLPDVHGKRVLDAGCGPGFYSQWLLERGAEVVAVDVSPKMVELARQRLGDRIEIHLADLAGRLDFLKSGSFEVVLCALVLDYVKDWDGLFAEFHRILRPRGHLVFSVGHPMTDYILTGEGSYFQTQLSNATWTGLGIPVVVPFYRRPLAAMTSALTNSGFLLEQIIEPSPTEECRRLYPKKYQRLSQLPPFICMRARKEDG